MNLQCFNDIITDDLAIHIDLSNQDSWDLNTGLTSVSLTKWVDAKSDNIELLDFGLTAFDVGRTDKMWDSINYTPKDTIFSMYRVGYNIVQNPTSGETSGVTINTEYLPISAITTGNSGNYFNLDGGYLQGFFKLDGYNYELLPPRFNNGITIETLLLLNPLSEGIFYLMGARAEDKYNPFFSGETTTGGTSNDINVISGVTTSEDNFLDAIEPKIINRNAFANYQNLKKTIHVQSSDNTNIHNNIIAFEITKDKRLGYKYIDENGLIVENKSLNKLSTLTGWTIIAITYEPNEIIEDPDLLGCYPRRSGTFKFHVNGKVFWELKDFSEFFFKSFMNDPEKQIGVPYSISWGGGSFGLKNSWHYDLQKYNLYTDQDTTYINNNFIVESDPIPEPCDILPPDIPIDGLSLSADSSTFMKIDECDSTIAYPITVMKIDYTGSTSGYTGTTGQTGTSANTYFIKFNEPISVLSNRDYVVDLMIYNDGFFKTMDFDHNIIKNSISIIPFGTVDVNILNEGEYKYPITTDDLLNLPNVSRNVFPDEQEYQYVKDGISYYGATGLPVYEDSWYYTYFGISPKNDNKHIKGTVVTGENKWINLKTTFRTEDNTGQQYIYLGILIETTGDFNLDGSLFVRNFTYESADILKQDERKDNLLIQQNFDSSFIGGIQKLRIYDKALSNSQIQHNAKMENKKNPNLNLIISKGGRIIYR